MFDEKKMKKTLYIKYTEQNPSDLSIGLSTLWKSLISIEKSIENSFKLSKINGDLNTKVIEAKKWSIIFTICIDFVLNNWIPFDNIQNFLDFLTLANYQTYENYRDILTQTFNWYTTLEKLIADHPLAYDIAKYFWSLVVTYIWIAKVAKTIAIYQSTINQPIHITNNYYCTPEQLQEIKSEVIKWSFNDILSPLIEDEISQLEVWTFNEEWSTESWVIIKSSDLWSYLSDWQEILPNFLNDTMYNIPWRITAMQVSRWESMQFKTNLNWKNRYLKLKSPDPVEEYRSDFNQDVILEAKVQRDSLYKKPTLILQKVANVATPLF